MREPHAEKPGGGVEVIRAQPRHAAAICALVRRMAEEAGERSPIDEAAVLGFLAFAGSGIFVAVDGPKVVGVLSYTARPSLFHAGTAGLVEDFVVEESRRGRGIGGRLMEAFLEVAETRRWVEVSVSTETTNRGAISFYRAYGFTDESLFLERHFESDRGA